MRDNTELFKYREQHRGLSVLCAVVAIPECSWLRMVLMSVYFLPLCFILELCVVSCVFKLGAIKRGLAKSG